MSKRDNCQLKHDARGEHYAVDVAWLDMPILRELGWLRHHSASNYLREHRNNGYEITYAAVGEFVWEVVGAERLVVHGGHVCLTQPRVLHKGEHDLMAPGSLFYLVMDPAAKGARRHTPFTVEELRTIDRNFAHVGNAVIRAHPDLPVLFDQLGKSMTLIVEGEDGKLYRPWVQAILCQILIATVRSFTTPARESQESGPVRAALAYIDANLSEDLPVELLAEVGGLSRSRFYESFRQETGLTPADYIQRLRCTRAGRELRTSTRSITEIAMKYGFSSSQYFATCFRKYSGMSPRQYRHQAWEDTGKG